MRKREHVLDNLEQLYREELKKTATSDRGRQSKLDFEFQRDQIYLEMFLGEKQEAVSSADSLLEKAQKIRQVTRLGK